MVKSPWFHVLLFLFNKVKPAYYMNLQEFYIVIYAMFVKNTDTNKFC